MPLTFLGVNRHPSPEAFPPPSLLYNNLSFVEECGALVYASRKDCIVRDVETQKTHVLPTGASEQEMILHCTATLAPAGLLHPEHSLLHSHHHEVFHAALDDALPARPRAT
ncbi:uncharacterized protein Tco025E_05005 [Trypanosoma conorhini]|uniref:Uncharacterized protein n=1 Tax=Trypanosoma conorhini TaxID=83891 RepID=A0A3R7N6A5_9TRYP|nr:uncharacterized protein Tco025E_05005 [Trypanosoma conorhini]RNF16880.1 hypothetical protein Tco025E_05005 [Trypanosoma conorhini]